MTESIPTARQLQNISASGHTLTNILIAVVVVSALYFCRDILVPIALAVLLSFVLSPLVRLLQRLRFPRAGAAVVVAIFAFGAIFGLGALMVSQVNQLAAELPSYQSTLQDKLTALRGVAGSTGPLERATTILQDLGRSIDSPRSPGGQAIGESALREGAESQRPIPVEVRRPNPGTLETLASLISPLIRPLATTGIVAVFTIFMLVQQKDLRNRLVRLAGAQDLHRTTAALDDAGERLSRLFLTQLTVNATFGLVIGVCLWVIGIPSAPLWGILGMILRFVPYIGTPISGIFPIILAAAAGNGWTMFAATLGLYFVLLPVVGQMIEPLVYGRSAGLTPVAVITSATFWTWIWGPVGLILATPLTICLVVIGRHVDRLNFLEVILSDAPPLTPVELTYQRLLANDPVEAVEGAETFLKTNTLIDYYDQILLGGLRLAQQDAAKGQFDADGLASIRDSVAEIVEDLSTHLDTTEMEDARDAESAEPASLEKFLKSETTQKRHLLAERWRSGRPVFCLPGIGLLDEAAAGIAAQLIEREGIGTRAERADALSVSRVFGWDVEGVLLVCICYVETTTAAQVRYAVRRVRRRIPKAHVVVALLGEGTVAESEDLGVPPDFVQHSMRGVVDRILDVARRGQDTDVPALVEAAS